MKTKTRIALVAGALLAASAAWAYELPSEVGNYVLYYGAISGGGGCSPTFNHLPTLQRYDLAILQNGGPAYAAGAPGGYEFRSRMPAATLAALRSHGANPGGRTRVLAYNLFQQHGGPQYARGIGNGWYEYADGGGTTRSLSCAASPYVPGATTCDVNVANPDWRDWFVNEWVRYLLTGSPTGVWNPNASDAAAGVFLDVAGACASAGHPWNEIDPDCALTRSLIESIHGAFPGALIVANAAGYLPAERAIGPRVHALLWEFVTTTPPALGTTCDQKLVYADLAALRAEHGTDVLLLGDTPTSVHPFAFSGDAELCRDAVRFTPNNPQCGNAWCGGCEPVDTGFLPYRPTFGYTSPPNPYQLNHCGDIDHR